MSSFNRRTVSRLWRLLGLAAAAPIRWQFLGLLILLAAFSLSLSGVNVLRSYVDRDFANALAARDQSGFFGELLWYALLFSVIAPLAVFYRFTEERLALMWRGWLSKRIIDAYLGGRAYYDLSLSHEIDNPDQRIEEDIRNFTASCLSYTLIMFNSLVALVAFIGVLWSISETLVVGALCYAALGSVVTYYLGRPLIDLNFQQLKKEGNYRYKLVNIRDHAESIAFFSAETEERRLVKDRLTVALENTKLIIARNRNVGFFTQGYNLVLAILPTVLVAPLYLRGEIEFGVIFQAGGAFGQVLGALSLVVVHFGGLSSFAAVINRLGSFWEAVEPGRGSLLKGERIERHEGAELRFERVSVVTPRESQPLVQDLSFSVPSGTSLLIAGPSGAGKSSLLRVCAGLWQLGQGRIICPARKDSFFVPQRPYMVLGDLRSQLVYGTGRQEIDDDEIQEIVEQLGLQDLVRRYGGFQIERDWPGLLSLGEQQLISIARLFLAKPRIAFLDEATNALDEKLRARVYELMKEKTKHYVSVGLRSELLTHHSRCLTLRGDGTWTLEE